MMKYLIFIALMLTEQASSAAVLPKIKFAGTKSNLEAGDSVNLSFTIINSLNRRVSKNSEAAQYLPISLYAYQSPSDCAEEINGIQVGTSFLYSEKKNSNYVFNTPGDFYLKAHTPGYTGSCSEKVSVKSPSAIFEKLSLNKKLETESFVKLGISWLSGSDEPILSTKERATIVLYSDNLCSSKIYRSRVYSVLPKNGTAEVRINKTSSSIYAKAKTILKSSECIPVSSVINKTIFIVGQEESNGYPYLSKAVIWINGIKTVLESNGTDSYANSIAVRGTNYYVGGGEYTESGNERATIWINGTKTILHDQENSISEVTKVILDETGTYYASGYIYNNQTLVSHAVLWINGAEIILADMMPGFSNSDFTESVVNDIVVKNGYYYAVGYVSHQGNRKAARWSNDAGLNPFEYDGYFGNYFLSFYRDENPTEFINNWSELRTVAVTDDYQGIYVFPIVGSEFIGGWFGQFGRAKNLSSGALIKSQIAGSVDFLRFKNGTLYSAGQFFMETGSPGQFDFFPVLSINGEDQVLPVSQYHLSNISGLEVGSSSYALLTNVSRVDDQLKPELIINGTFIELGSEVFFQEHQGVISKKLLENSGVYYIIGNDQNSHDGLVWSVSQSGQVQSYNVIHSENVSSFISDIAVSQD